MHKAAKLEAVVVGQLVERSLPTPEIRSSNPDTGEILSTNCTFEKTNTIKRGQEGQSLKKAAKLRIKFIDSVPFIIAQSTSKIETARSNQKIMATGVEPVDFWS